MTNRFSKKELSKQETLTKDRLKKLAVGYNEYPNRPEQSLIQVVHWARRFVEEETTKQGWIPFIHNKISIDGAFLQYAEESKAQVRAIHTDALTSWKSDHDDEHFVGIGIFEIIIEDIKFYHCGLFHKGNQNEDEVSFFVLVQQDDFDKYANFRNGFENWQKKRERESQEIEVIGGDPIPYDINMLWDDVFLPDNLKLQIKNTVEGFLNSKHVYEKLKVPWRRGIGFWGFQGCGKTSMLRLLMAQYPQLKPVTIQPGHQQPDELLENAFEYAEEHGPSLLFFEDLQELVKTIDLRHFLQLLDGLQKRDGILTVVTGNDFSDLEENLKSRPRRFDGFFKFPLPDVDQCKKYLSKYFADILSENEIANIASKSVKRKFTYAHLQEIYFNAVFIAIPAGREMPNSADIDLSLKQVSAGKKAADSDFLAQQRDLTDDISDERDVL